MVLGTISFYEDHPYQQYSSDFPVWGSDGHIHWAHQDANSLVMSAFLDTLNQDTNAQTTTPAQHSDSSRRAAMINYAAAMWMQLIAPHFADASLLSSQFVGGGRIVEGL